MVKPIKAIYLTGWEYNRILGDHPCTPRNSALPAEILWNGSAQLWLFEKVYVTKESVENERYGAEKLDWTTNRIFAELADDSEKWFEEVDWQQLPTDTKTEMSLRCDQLRNECNIEISVRMVQLY